MLSAESSQKLTADVENIEINIPISEENIVEQDDFAIRVYDFYYKEYEIKHTVTHDAKGITIKISDIPASLIAELKENIGDGLTVEIHSYCKEDDNVWAEMKNSTVKTGKNVTFSGQVTSAFNDEVVTLYLKK